MMGSLRTLEEVVACYPIHYKDDGTSSAAVAPFETEDNSLVVVGVLVARLVVALAVASFSMSPLQAEASVLRERQT
jgi:hypothetical protein